MGEKAARRNFLAPLAFVRARPNAAKAERPFMTQERP